MKIYELKKTECEVMDWLCGFTEFNELSEETRAKLVPAPAAEKAETEDEEDAEEAEPSLEAIEELLSQINLDKNNKINYLARVYKNATAMADALKAEKLAIAKRQSQKEKEAERIKSLLSFLLTDSEGKIGKFESEYAKITTRKSEEVKFRDGADFSAFPEEYVRVKYEGDKTAIKKAIKEGASNVPEAAYIEQKTSLIIK